MEPLTAAAIILGGSSMLSGLMGSRKKKVTEELSPEHRRILGLQAEYLSRTSPIAAALQGDLGKLFGKDPSVLMRAFQGGGPARGVR